MFLFIMIVLLATMLLLFISIIKYKSILSKLLCSNSLTTLMLLFIVVHGYWQKRADFLDNALTIATLTFVSMFAINHLIVYFRRKYSKSFYRDEQSSQKNDTKVNQNNS